MAEYVDRFALRDALYDADAITMRGVKIINQFPTAVDAVPVRWIPVTERLPEDDPNAHKYIDCEKFGFITVLVYNGVVKQTNRFFCNGDQFGLKKTNGWEWASSNVTHWMPLPVPPKGE